MFQFYEERIDVHSNIRGVSRGEIRRLIMCLN